MRLSICIATYNRARFIGETLDSVVAQLRPDVEIVIVDGASPDDTPAIVAKYVARLPNVRYFREAINSGVDRDYDKAVGYARGVYCWLFPDDDVLAPGAVDRVLASLKNGETDLLIVDAEVRDVTLQRRLRAGRLKVRGEQAFGPGDADAFLSAAGYALSFIGCVIISRSLWLARNREPYFGSLFVHVGVILQGPGVPRAKILAEPLVQIRAGNAMWQPRAFEIWALKWPSLIWSFEGYGAEAKRAVTPREPWRQLWWLLAYRALGAYSKSEYRRYISRHASTLRLGPVLVAHFPGWLANLIGIAVLAGIGKGGSDDAYYMAACSRHSTRAGRWLAGIWLRGLFPPQSPLRAGSEG